MKALEILINSINAQIKEFNKANFEIYDIENPNYFISGIEYDSDEDKIYVKFEENK